MSPDPEVVADNEMPGAEPEGFWDPVHAEVDTWTEANESG